MRLSRRRAAAAALLTSLVASGCLQEATSRAPSTTPPAAPGSFRGSGDPRARFVDAVALYERGAFDAADPLFRALLTSYPALEDYHLAYLAALEHRRGREREAAAFDDRLIANHPASVWLPKALARRAQAALALGDPRTEELAARAVAASEGDVDARGTALSVQAALRAPSAPRDAYELYQSVRRGGGEAAPAARAASAALEEAHPELLRDPDLLLAEGRQLLAEGKSDLAVTRLESAVGVAPAGTKGEALRALAKTYQQTGRLEDALATYRAAVAAEPPSGMARFELATLLWNRDRDAEARALFTQIVAQAPPHPKRDTARYALGRIAEQDGRSADAVAQFRVLAASSADGELAREARWRLAWMPYRSGDLAAALDAFAALGAGSGADRAASLYWRGRVLGSTGRADEGRALYEAVLAETPDGYYADLAEHALAVTAPPPPPPTPLAAEPPPSLTLHAYHWIRSRELKTVGMNAAAARELAALTRELPDGGEREPYLLAAYTELEAHGRALKLATRLGADTLAPSTLAAYSYPRAYWPRVATTADAERVDPYVVLALMRQESLFDPDAVSPAAAYGLMQLLVGTASRVAGRDVDRSALLDPGTNIQLGTRYLRQLLDRYQGNLAKALAAYNGGEEAVAKWERRAPGAADDEFVEAISYRETRNYVKQVIANYRRYRRLYGAPGEERAVERSADGGRYDADGRPSAATSLPARPPNPPFDISTTTSPGAA